MEEFSVTFKLGPRSAKRMKELMDGDRAFGIRIFNGSRRYGYTCADIIEPPYTGKILCRVPRRGLSVSYRGEVGSDE